MKRNLLIMLCLIATNVFAQDFDMGVKGGVNFARSVILDVAGPDGIDMDALETHKGSALVLGGFMRFAGEKWLFQPEFLVSESKSLVSLDDVDVEDLDFEDFITLSVDKVDVPCYSDIN